MSKFWDKFDQMFKKMDEMFDELPDYIDEQMEKSKKRNSWFSNNVVSKSTTITNGKKIVVETINGKTNVTINGKEYIEKGKDK